MNRRSFITSLVAGVVAPMFLPGAGRIWVPAAQLEIVFGTPLDWYKRLHPDAWTFRCAGQEWVTTDSGEQFRVYGGSFVGFGTFPYNPSDYH